MPWTTDQWGYEEFVTGQYPVPSRDGSDYDGTSHQPTPREVMLDVLEEDIKGPIVVIAIGETGSPNHNVSGISTKTTVIDLENFVRNFRKGSYRSVEAAWSAFFGVKSPLKHVSSIVIRPLE